MNKSSKYQTGGLEDLSAEDILENSSNFSGSNVESGAYD